MIQRFYSNEHKIRTVNAYCRPVKTVAVMDQPNRRDAYGLYNQLNRAIGRTVTAKTAINRLIQANLKAEEYVKKAL